MREQTSILLTIQGIVARYENIKLSGNKLKSIEEERLLNYIKDDKVKLAVQTRFVVLRSVMKQVTLLESKITKSLKGNEQFKLLKTIPGIGVILGMTILLETGCVERFKSVGNYSSYCRCVGSKKNK